MKKLFVFVPIAVLMAVLVAACGSGGKATQPSAADKAVSASNALQSQVYQSTHNVEFRNYNLRQKLADDPSTILWCTFFPPTVGQQPFTVPIAGKLTSSNKRPYNDVRYQDAGNYSWYAQQVPGPDHMFGASSEYRYGFDPTLQNYADFYSLASYCTNVPKVWQQNKTTIVADTSVTLNSISRQAQAALKAGDAQKAAAILKGAEGK